MTKAAELAKMGEVLTNSQIGGRRNLFYNPKAFVAQRGTTSIGATSDGYGSVDRFKLNNQSTAVIEISQSTDVPTGQGFANSIRLNITTADTSLTSGVQALFRQRFEGQDLQHLKKGTSSAETTVLSFWVRSAKSGTHIVELFDTDNSRHINKAYTVSSADTWEHKEITIEGDTTGAFTNDVNTSLEVTWHLAAGSDFTSGTLQTSWGSRTNANRAVGQVNVFDSTDNNFYLTGIQWELGSQATPFEHRSFGEELALCQRYFQYLPSGSVGRWLSSTTAEVCCNFATLMRAVPTISINPNDNTCAIYRLGISTNNCTVSGLNSTYIAESGGMVPLTVSSTASTPSAGDMAMYDTDGASEVVFCDSEL